MSDTGPQTIAELMDLEDDAAESTPPRVWQVEPGSTFHAIADGITVRTGAGPAGLDGVVLQRGQTVVLTSAMIEASLDRNGNSWMLIIDDEDAQVAKWGDRRLAPGRAPAAMRPWRRGSIEADIEADRQRRAVVLLPEDERPAALARIAAEFGRERTSHTISQLDGGRNA